MFQKIILIFIIFILSFQFSCGSEKKSSKQTETLPENASGSPPTCDELVARIDVCAKEKRLNERFRLDKVKTWIREDCEKLGRENPSMQSKLLECASADCTKQDECFRRILQERKP